MTRQAVMSEREREIFDNPLPTPNLETGEVYWLSSKTKPPVFAPVPVRAHKAQEAARRAVQWTGRAILVWHQTKEGGLIVWVERPSEGAIPNDHSMQYFSYVP